MNWPLTKTGPLPLKSNGSARLHRILITFVRSLMLCTCWRQMLAFFLMEIRKGGGGLSGPSVTISVTKSKKPKKCVWKSITCKSEDPNVLILHIKLWNSLKKPTISKYNHCLTNRLHVKSHCMDLKMCYYVSLTCCSLWHIVLNFFLEMDTL